MANFKIGQRVTVRDYYHDVRDGPNPNGQEGNITAADPYGLYCVALDRLPTPKGCTSWRFFGRELAPLTDSGFEQFMERVMKPINEPVTA